MVRYINNYVTIIIIIRNKIMNNIVRVGNIVTGSKNEQWGSPPVQAPTRGEVNAHTTS